MFHFFSILDLFQKILPLNFSKFYPKSPENFTAEIKSNIYKGGSDQTAFHKVWGFLKKPFWIFWIFFESNLNSEDEKMVKTWCNAIWFSKQLFDLWWDSWRFLFPHRSCKGQKCPFAGCFCGFWWRQQKFWVQLINSHTFMDPELTSYPSFIKIGWQESFLRAFQSRERTQNVIYMSYINLNSQI